MQRKNSFILLLVTGVLLTVGAFAFIQFQRAFGVKDKRVVQILESPDKQHKAELIRRHDLFDLNFFIQLDGEQIYRSEDFRPNDTIPFRETILWDVTEQNLIFEIGGYRLFGYNLAAKHRLSDKELLSLKVKKLKPEDFRTSARWPGYDSP